MTNPYSPINMVNLPSNDTAPILTRLLDDKISEEISNTREWQKILIRLNSVSALEVHFFFFF